MLQSLFFLLALVAVAQATSVRPVLHECPVCGEKSVTIALMSYSSFGEPARDLSDSPRHSFSNVEVCPNDLFAGWSGTWKSMKPDEKAKLAEFLKQPTLHLTDQEKEIIEGHEAEFRKSRWFPLIWARSCDELRSLEPREKFDRILWFHYKGCYTDEHHKATELETRLTAHYREQAITALKEAQTAEWAKPLDKRVYAYLQAELTRQAGRDDEALSLFQNVIHSERALKPDEETSWILAWATEQSLRVGDEAKDPNLLISAILPDMPDPWQSVNITRNPKWSRHYAALDILAQQASSGKKPFSDALWKLLDRKPERLLAFLETSSTSISSLGAVDHRWREWFDEISTLLDQGKLPPALSKHPNHTRVRNILKREVTPDNDKHSTWLMEVFLPGVQKCAANGGIPSIPIPNTPFSPGLPMSGIGDDGASKKPLTPPTMNEISRALYELWELVSTEERTVIAQVYVRILHKLGDESDSFDYPVMYFLPAIAETEEGRAAIRGELKGPWKSTFWKAACAYAAGTEDSQSAFVSHPVTSRGDDSLVVKLFLQKSDPSWKDTAIKKLGDDEYISMEVVQYLASLDLPETRKALDDFARKTRNSTNDRDNVKLYTLQDLDQVRVNAGLSKIPIR